MSTCIALDQFPANWSMILSANFESTVPNLNHHFLFQNTLLEDTVEAYNHNMQMVSDKDTVSRQCTFRGQSIFQSLNKT